MSEATENNTEQKVEPKNEVQYSEVEQRAIEKGWVPKDEYNGDPEHFKSAEVFLALEEPIKRIESQSKELKAVRKALEAMQAHHSKVEEAAYNRALAELQAQKKKALTDGDFEKYDEITEQISSVKETAQQIKQSAQIQVQEPTQENPEFTFWKRRNPWYEADRKMAAYADALGQELHARGVPKNEILKRVEEDVKKEFPTRFRNPNKDNTNSVEGNSNKRGTGSNKAADIELTDQEKTIMNTLVRGGHITKEKYLADLRKVKGLE